MDFTTGQLVAIGLIFVWSGFVRASLGFGGAALSLPLLLLVSNTPLFYLPIAATHLLLFSAIHALPNTRLVDWKFIRFALKWSMVPKLIGVIGLFTLPETIMTVIIYTITIFYSLQWILERNLQSSSPWTDRLLLIVGGYFSGTSLVGAPLITTVAIRQVAPKIYRDTLFLLWFILVSIKVGAFAMLGVDLQWQWSLILLAPTTLGHFIGLYFHHRLTQQAPEQVRRVLGFGLLLVAIIGISRIIFS